MKRYKSVVKKNLMEDNSGSWGSIKKEALSFMNQYSKCEINYKEYSKSNFDIKNVKYTFKAIFTAYLKDGKFNFSPKDSMNATLYVDEAKGLKFWGDTWELYILVD